MKKSKILLFVLVVAMVFTLTAFASESEARDFTYENSLATDLKALGLFSGVSDTDFDLERAPSRVEVLVMLIRVLGEEKTAVEGEWEHPFTDVPAWANPYVGYAYENGLTKGVSETKFGTDTASATTYLTFVLRALGYSDAKGDFRWDAPHKLAAGLGLLPDIVDTENFLRADIVTISYAALYTDIKNETVTLAEKLIEKGALDAGVFGKSYTATKITDKQNEGKEKLSAEDIYAKCSPAVFYIEIQNENGGALSSGSGFFIEENGVAVTNWHVIDGAKKAVVTLAGSGAKYDVTGVYYYNPEQDIAVIQVDGNDFETLAISPYPLKGASAAYAIGSPEGLQNTISTGIISNSRRVVLDAVYIQTTAAISNGSSGGVLLNEYGEAVGITSASYTDGQSLNFARPVNVLAMVDTTTPTALADVNWNYARYTLREDSYTVKAGEIKTIEFDVLFENKDGEVPTCFVESSDEKVLAVTTAFGDTFVRLVGVAPGTATVTVSDNLSSSSASFDVTVTEGENMTPHIEYFVTSDEILLAKDVTKEYCVEALGVLMDEDVTFTVKILKDSVARMKHVVDDEAETVSAVVSDGVCKLKFTGLMKGTTTVLISNSLTDEVLRIPVTVGDTYAPSFERIVNHVIENGEEIKDDNAKTEYYMVEGQANPYNGDVPQIFYYPSEEKVCFRVFAKETGVKADLIFTADRKAYFRLEYSLYGIVGYGDIIPASFKEGYAVKFDEYDGGTDFSGDEYETYFESLSPSLILIMLVEFDHYFKYDVPGMSMNDFGFTKIDISEYSYF